MLSSNGLGLYSDSNCWNSVGIDQVHEETDSEEAAVDEEVYVGFYTF